MLKPESQKTIFIVDDDPMYLWSLENFLRKNTEHRYFCCGTGEDCLKHISISPDIVILDYFLNSNVKKAKNGLEILKSIKEISPETEVILLSNQEDYSIVYKTIVSGAATYLIKDKNVFLNVLTQMDDILQEKQIINNVK
ncbi:MAG: response regulator [Deltaproteobacteria bacterium]|nr:response regulator [Deltaproteobacteria bacterium]